jgi:hypothetical protein
MFNLEENISEWRRQMLAAGIGSPAPLEELEGHLREDYEQLLRSGQSTTAAFAAAVSQIGQPEGLQIEFAEVRETVFERLMRFLHASAIVPHPQPVTNLNMNISNSHNGPRWATYAKARTFIFPAAFLWLFTAVFVLPKVNEICQAAGTQVFNFSQAPAVFRGAAVVGQIMVFLTNHGLLICSAAILAFILLERYSQLWARYRRLAVSTGVFLLNAVVLVSLTLMVISMLIAAPNIAHHAP